MNGATLIGVLEVPAVAALLAFVRIRLLFSVIPFFDASTLPGMVRNLVAVALTAVVFPLVYDQVEAAGMPDWPLLVVLIIKEAAIGFLLGFLVSMTFWIVGSIGFFIDTQRGSTMASQLNPLFGEQESTLGSYLTVVATTLFFSTGGVTAFLDLMYASYQTWPVLSYVPHFKPEKALFFLEQFDWMIYLMVFIGGPVVLAMFLSEIGLAFVGRFAPQLNVFFLAMPVKSAVALFIMIGYTAVAIDFFEAEYAAFILKIPELSEVLQ